MRSHLRQFLVIVAVVFVVWVVMVMSEHHTYTTVVPIEWVGYDKARYVVAQADTVVTLEIVSNGFSAVSRWRSLRNHKLQLQADRSGAVSIEQVVAATREQLDFSSMHGVRSNSDSVRVCLRERFKKGFVPDISAVEFEFSDQYGISGAPQIIPDTVYLYGDRDVLSHIESVKAKPAKVNRIAESGRFKVCLAPQSHGDIYASVDSVEVVLNVEQYVERRFDVPVRLVLNDSSLHVRLYPDQVRVTLFVPRNEYKNISPSMLSAEARYEDANETTLPVMLHQFPANVRVKQIEPSEVQYVVIRKVKK